MTHHVRVFLLLGTLLIATAAQTQTFSCTNGAQTFVVPADVNSVVIEGFGGAGGSSLATGVGGKAGYISATCYIAAGTVVQVNVGCFGQSATTSNHYAGVGGYNGGGAGAAGAGGGGGATDVRVGGIEVTNRILVAAGGGGAGDYAAGSGYNGGAGGGEIGYPGYETSVGLSGSGGSQTSGGSSGCFYNCGSYGGFGNGGTGAQSEETRGGGGGGGSGYYGGGGGGNGYGGGGGSSYASSSVCTNVVYTTTAAGPSSGDGSLTVTFVTSPTSTPTAEPTSTPTSAPSARPTVRPTAQPSAFPSSAPSTRPSYAPTSQPSAAPSSAPSTAPSARPSAQPSAQPSTVPSAQPSAWPSGRPSSQPSGAPTAQPSRDPTAQPSAQPTAQPSAWPTTVPTTRPSHAPISSADSNVAAVPVVFMVLANVFARLLRRGHEDSLNEVSPLVVQALHIAVNGASWFLFLQTFFTYYDEAANQQNYARQWLATLLVASKLPLLLAWVAFLLLLFAPNTAAWLGSCGRRSSAGGGAPRGSTSSVADAAASDAARDAAGDGGDGGDLPLRVYLNARIISPTYTIAGVSATTFCGLVILGSVFDLYALRYLPWNRSADTKRLRAFPTKTMVRLCLYSTALSAALQACASLAIFVEQTQKSVAGAFFIGLSLVSALIVALDVLMLMVMSSVSLAQDVRVHRDKLPEIVEELVALMELHADSEERERFLSLAAAKAAPPADAAASFSAPSPSSASFASATWTSASLFSASAAGWTPADVLSTARKLRQRGAHGGRHLQAHYRALLYPATDAADDADVLQLMSLATAQLAHDAALQANAQIALAFWFKHDEREAAALLAVLLAQDAEDRDAEDPAADLDAPDGERLDVRFYRNVLQEAAVQNVPTYRPWAALQTAVADALLAADGDDAAPMTSAAVAERQRAREAALEQQLLTLSFHPVFRAEVRLATLVWERQEHAFLRGCFLQTVSFLPPVTSLLGDAAAGAAAAAAPDSLRQRERQLQRSAELLVAMTTWRMFWALWRARYPRRIALRLSQRPALWLVRLSPRLIDALLTVSDLTAPRGKFNALSAQHADLDLVELAAVYFALPARFSADHDLDGRKQRWKNRLLTHLRHRLRLQRGDLLEHLRRQRARPASAAASRKASLFAFGVAAGDAADDVDGDSDVDGGDAGAAPLRQLSAQSRGTDASGDTRDGDGDGVVGRLVRALAPAPPSGGPPTPQQLLRQSRRRQRALLRHPMYRQWPGAHGPHPLLPDWLLLSVAEAAHEPPPGDADVDDDGGSGDAHRDSREQAQRDRLLSASGWFTYQPSSLSSPGVARVASTGGAPPAAAVRRGSSSAAASGGQLGDVSLRLSDIYRGRPSAPPARPSEIEMDATRGPPPSAPDDDVVNPLALRRPSRLATAASSVAAVASVAAPDGTDAVL